MGCFDRHIGNTFMAVEDVTNVQGCADAEKNL